MGCERASISFRNLRHGPFALLLSCHEMQRAGGGDDLDDDFVPDDLVALSDAEDEEGSHSADGEDIAGLLSADEGVAQGASTSQVTVEKKRKRRAKQKERRAKVRPPWHESIPGFIPTYHAAETQAHRGTK